MVRFPFFGREFRRGLSLYERKQGGRRDSSKDEFHVDLRNVLSWKKVLTEYQTSDS